ncbi:amino acid ABC transporter substrate-binding protein [Campylobacter sp. RM12920]|uniref:Amino acid ABC transporter substrate-binding protein n=1 Tax=Campylobacter californiensis TaxID=1032243 RepID=A0ABD4JL23_9BACT|nr:amino acid ABC transporter substrate-binding protein [Campylobacter sp. RM12919]MBE2989030.1 amino acid ABC transporter substrate-binding protein [Campylobacter sp. RM12920]
MKIVFKILVTSMLLCIFANAKTLKDGTLTVATEGTYSPFSYYNEKHKLVGYDVDIARAIADELGLKINFVTAPWDAILAAFDAGKADTVLNQVSITDERKKKYDYTEPYTVAYAALVVRADNEEIKGFDDLKGKKSAHSATSNWAKMASRYGAQIVTVDGFSKGVELVITKRADATINDNVTYFDYMKQRPKAPLKIIANSSEPIYTAAIVKKDNTELLNQMDEALKSLRKKGVLKEISIRYFGEDVSE